MTPHFLKRWFRSPWDSSLQRREFPYRPSLEPLEDRILLDAGLPPAIVVGRTLSAYTTGAIQNSQETITYTVYNEQSNPVSGVLLTDTLQPGVSFQSASQLPDQSGQNLAWSLGTIAGFDRTSVTLTVSLANPVPLQLDAGAQAFATLDAGAVSNATPAAVLRQGSVDPSLLASTPDANTTDPFVQEEAAKLQYNPQQIFDFLHSDIGYNSYTGSLRGARGTLWSGAGNALDVASLGVALMRASGIPARYDQGTLPDNLTQQLILSMFPQPLRVAGCLDPGTALADPGHDPQLLAETDEHYWFEFDAGSGFRPADPLIGGAQIGQTFATTQTIFGEVPDGLRHKVEVKLNAELTSSVSQLFGQGPQSQTVLDETFDTVDLVGRPITIGHFVNTTQIQAAFVSSKTITYSPYIRIDDDNADPAEASIIRGTDYQEVLTNFPLASQVLTGLFLQTTLLYPEQNGTRQAENS